MRFRIIFTLLFSLHLIGLYAQKIVRVHGEYTYYVPENISVDEGKRTALYRAQIQALANAFGTVISQSNTTIVKNENGKSSAGMLSLGGSNVKGEWLETLGEPKYNISYESGMLVVRVEVEGKAREMKNNIIDLDMKVLRNGTEPKFESDEFKDGDDLYFYFKSPVDGYLAVYLLDEATQEVFCLLPYKSSGSPTYKIVHDKPYVFFSAMKAEGKTDEVDEYTMTCSNVAEYNTLYVIFSSNLFAKANTEGEDPEMPRRLTLRDFQKWLKLSETKDSNLQVKYKSFKISSK